MSPQEAEKVLNLFKIILETEQLLQSETFKNNDTARELLQKLHDNALAQLLENADKY